MYISKNSKIFSFRKKQNSGINLKKDIMKKSENVKSVESGKINTF